MADLDRLGELIKTDQDPYFDPLLTDRDLIRIMIANGLFSYSGDPHFSWNGCDYCKSGGSEVYGVEGYLHLEGAQSDPEGNKLTFEICGHCISNLYLGEK